MNTEFLGAIFDLDGTVLDSMQVWEQVDAKFLGNHGLPTEQKYIDTVKAMAHKQSAVFTIDYFGLDAEPEDIIAEWHGYAIDAYRTSIQLKPGVADFLRYLKGVGTGIAAATSSLAEHAPEALKRLGVHDLFDVITFTDEAARPKSHPDVYLLAARRLGLTPDRCVVFEDLPEGVRSAKLGGFYSVAVLDDFYKERHEETIGYSDLVIRSFEELKSCDLKFGGKSK